LTNVLTTPESGGWSEVMINYTAGIVRRGLMGQILYYLSNYVNISIFYPLFLLVIYILVWSFIIYNLTKVINIYYSLLCILSPAILIFPINGTGNYFRRDIFVIFFATFFMYICTQKLINKYKISIYILTIIFYINYFISYLIAEISLFFMPIAAILLGICCYEVNKFRFWLITMIFLGLLSLIVTFTIPLNPDIFAIIKSFPLEISDSYSTVTALNLSFIDFINMVIKCWLEYNTVIISLPILLVLAFFPIILIYKKYKISYIIKNIIYNKYINVIFLLSLLCPFSSFFIGCDYGRWVYMISIIYLFLLCMILSIAKYKKLYNTDEFNWPKHGKSASIFLFIYATSWSSGLWFTDLHFNGVAKFLRNIPIVSNIELKRFKSGDNISFLLHDDAWKHVWRKRWQYPTPGGMWASSPISRDDYPDSEILLIVTSPIKQLTFDMVALVNNRHKEQRIIIKINNFTVPTIYMTLSSGNIFNVDIPEEVQISLLNGGEIKLSFWFPDAVSPRAIGAFDQDELYALILKSITLR
jgi:hypothetical protein